MEKFVSDKIKSSMYFIKNIRRIRRFLTQSATKTIVHAYFTVWNQLSSIFKAPAISPNTASARIHFSSVLLYHDTLPLWQSLHWQNLTWPSNFVHCIKVFFLNFAHLHQWYEAEMHTFRALFIAVHITFIFEIKYSIWPPNAFLPFCHVFLLFGAFKATLSKCVVHVY